MVSAKPILALAAAALCLAACGGKPRRSGTAPRPRPRTRASLSPPRVDAARSGLGGVTLTGPWRPRAARCGSRPPPGEATFAAVDPQGHWTLALAPAEDPRIFGLSATSGARQIQAEGYVLISPSGPAALLRAGAGALRLDPQAKPGLRAIDFDRGGGMEVSAQVAPGATVILQIDGRQAAEARADSSGRYEASLGAQAPIRPGTHQVVVFGDGFRDQASAQVTAAAPLVQGPLRSQLTPEPAFASTG